jgi:adenylate cyclase
MGAGASAMAPAYAPVLGDNYDPDKLNDLIQAGITRMNRLTEELAFTNSSVRLLSNQLGCQLVRSEYSELQERFKEWEAASERKKKLKLRQIQARFVYPKVLFASDMSGFSRICKEEGILHFLSLVKIMQSIMLPLLEARGGQLVKVAADNLFVIFDDPKQAVRSAWDCKAAAACFSKGKTANNSIKMSIGIAMGDMWVVEGADVFGDAAHVAFKLGEDISSKEVLIGPNVYNALGKDDYNYEAREGDFAGEIMTYYKVETKGKWPNPPMPERIRPVINPPINSEEPLDFVTLLARRQGCERPEDKHKVDILMNKRFTQKKAVLVIEMHEQAEISRRDGVLSYISQVLRMKRICSSSVADWRGKTVRAVDTKVVGQVFALFDNPADAVSCALECTHDCHNESFELACGIGFTDVLNLDACNVFGDAVNMAFKLGEDVAGENEILVTENVVKSIRRTSEYLILEPEKAILDKSTSSVDLENANQILVSLKDTRTVTLSGVTIPHWNLSLSSRDCKKLTAANHSAGVAGGSVSKARKNVTDTKKIKDAMSDLKSRVNTMNAMTMGEWTPGKNDHLDHGQDESEITAQNRGKFMVSGMTPRSVDDDE